MLTHHCLSRRWIVTLKTLRYSGSFKTNALDSPCPPPSDILKGMNHETNCHRTDVECRESGEAIVLASHIEPSAFDVQRSLFDVPPGQRDRLSAGRSLGAC